MPDFRDLRGRRPKPGADRRGSRPASSASFLRDVMRAERAQPQLPRLRPGRDRVEPPGAPSSRRRDRLLDRRDRWPDDEHLAPEWPGDGNPERAPRARAGSKGYLLTGRHGLLLLLRGVHPHRRLDVQPARQVAQGDAAASRGGAPIASLNYLLTSHVWRQDHNGFSHQDPGLHRPRASTRRPRSSGSTCRRTRTRCCP